MNRTMRYILPAVLAGTFFTAQTLPAEEKTGEVNRQEAVAVPQQQAQPPQQQVRYPYGRPMRGHGWPMMTGDNTQPCPMMREPDMIYGYELMSSKEREEYLGRLHSAGSFEERERLRYEHYQQMQERAKKRGMILPGMEPDRGYYGPGWRWR